MQQAPGAAFSLLVADTISILRLPRCWRDASRRLSRGRYGAASWDMTLRGGCYAPYYLLVYKDA